MEDINQIIEDYHDLLSWDLFLIYFHHEEMYKYTIDNFVKGWTWGGIK